MSNTLSLALLARRAPRRAGLRAGLLFVTCALFLLAACAHEPKPAPVPARSLPPAAQETGGTHHTIRPGETVWRISRRYGVSVEAILRANGIRDVRKVPAGARLWIPGARGLAPLGGATAVRRAAEGELAFGWPAEGRLSSRYGVRRGRRHEGIDLSAPRGTAVHAAEAGRVIYSGSGLGAYGKTVIVKHIGRYSTVYAHNRRNRVAKGDFVEKGQVIAEVGSTGNASGPHLHFEVRVDDRPHDPLRYLPASVKVARRR